MTTRTSVRDYIPSANSDTEPLIQSNKNTKKVRLSVRDAEQCSKNEDNEMRDVPCSYLLFKAFILFCISLMGWSMFLAMDLQAGLENQFQAENGLNMTHAHFNNFMTFFSIPNIPGSIIGGFMVSKITHRKGSPIFVLGMILGQLIGALGAIKKSSAMLFLGRAVFGLMCELTNICTFAHIVFWFKGKIYNFAFAVVVAMARLGTVSIMIGGPVVVEFMDSLVHGDGSKMFDSTMQITYVYLGTSVLLLVGLVSAFYLLCITPKNHDSEDNPTPVEDTSEEKFTNSNTWNDTLGDLAEQAKLPVPAWLVIAICMIFYSAIEPWVIGAKTSFEVFHGVTDPKISALLSAMISIVPIPLGPVLGLMVDAVKGNAWWCLTGSLLSIFGHLALATHIFSASLTAPFWLLLSGNILIGLGYSMVAGSIWSLLSYTVPSKQTSIAYGMIQAFQHIGIIFATLVSGYLVDSASDVRVGYFYSELFFMATLMVSLFLCVFFVLVYGAGSKSMYPEENGKKSRGPH
jgi:MFS family permease